MKYPTVFIKMNGVLEFPSDVKPLIGDLVRIFEDKKEVGVAVIDENGNEKILANVQKHSLGGLM